MGVIFMDGFDRYRDNDMPAYTEKPKRSKLFPIYDQDIMSCFLTSQTGFPFLKEPGTISYMTRLRFKNLPDDVVITAGFYDMTRNCFMVRVEHESFEEVLHGMLPPIDNAEIEHIFCDHEGKFIKSEVTERKSWRDHPSWL